VERIRIGERRSDEARCAFCREPAPDEDRYRAWCSDCGVVVHRACRGELRGGCPSLGCHGRWVGAKPDEEQVQAHNPGSIAARQRRNVRTMRDLALATVGLLLLVLAGLTAAAHFGHTSWKEAVEQTTASESLQILATSHDQAELQLAREVFARRGAAAVPEILAGTSRSEPDRLREARREALRSTGRPGWPGLVDVLQRGQPVACEVVLSILPELDYGWGAVAEVRALALDGQGPTLRIAAVRTLCQLRGPGVVAALGDVLAQGSSLQRHQAALGLREQDQLVDAFDGIALALSDPDADVRLALMGTMRAHRQTPKQVCPALLDLLEDPALAPAAQGLLETVGPLDQATREDLLRRAANLQLAARERYLDLLVRQGTWGAAAAVDLAAVSGDVEAARAIRRAGGSTSRLLSRLNRAHRESADVRARIQVLRCVGALSSSGRSAVDWVGRSLQAPQPAERAAARGCLTELGGPTAAEALVEAALVSDRPLDDVCNDLRTLAEGRWELPARAIGQLRDSLLPLTRHEHAVVRTAATEALRRLR
jgi:hypothetical protein